MMEEEVLNNCNDKLKDLCSAQLHPSGELVLRIAICICPALSSPWRSCSLLLLPASACTSLGGHGGLDWRTKNTAGQRGLIGSQSHRWKGKADASEWDLCRSRTQVRDREKDDVASSSDTQLLSVLSALL